MKNLLTRLIFILAEKGKHIGVNREKLRAALYLGYRFLCKLMYRFGNYLYLYHVEIPVTQKCSLRCKDCVFMMTKFEHPVDYDLEKLLTYMDRLFKVVDGIQIFRILGGEPFIYKNLALVIKKRKSMCRFR